MHADTVVLVEGTSDQRALEALAARRGRDLEAEGIAVVSMGGATNIARFLERYGPPGLDLGLAGLCDVGEEDGFRRGLEATGVGSDLGRAEMEQLRFHVCDRDLEDELIRALGVAAVERVLGAEGDLGPFRTFQRQPAWRERNPQDQLRRFFGTTSGRKIRSAPALVDALDLTAVPRPLDLLLTQL